MDGCNAKAALRRCLERWAATVSRSCICLLKSNLCCSSENRQRGLEPDFRYRSLLGTCQLTQYSLQMPLRDTYEIVKMHCS